MAATAYISPNRGSGQQKKAQRPAMGALETEVFSDMCARLRQIGWEEAEEHYQPLIDKKDEEIEKLKAQIAEMQKQQPASAKKQTDNVSAHTYNYNASCFPKPNGDIIIDAIVELAHCKREHGKFIINKKTDWYMVWKVLHYFGVYTGNEYDFINVVNECVLPCISDKERRENLSVCNDNFKNIRKDDPKKKVSVHLWRIELDTQRENSKGQHGTFSLERGINIKVKLQQLLQAKGVESINFEK